MDTAIYEHSSAKQHGDCAMKRILLIASAALLFASPIFAQTQGSDEKAGVQTPAATTGQAQPTAPKTAPAARGANDVYCGGQYIGSDPDPKVRQQMMRDFKHECE
jgi:hypothetical protein